MNHKRPYSIFAMVDRFSKIVHLITCKKTIDESHVAKLFIKIVSLHSLTKTIIYDNDVRFTSYF